MLHSNPGLLGAEADTCCRLDNMQSGQLMPFIEHLTHKKKDTQVAQHRPVFKRLIRCAEDRATMVGEEITLADVARQVALRTALVKTTTTRAEIAHAKKALREIQFEGGQARPGDYLGGHPWISNSTIEDRDFALDILSTPFAEFNEMGADLIEDDLSRLSAHVDLYGRKEVVAMITGVSNTVTKTSQKDQRYLTARDLRLIEMELSSHDPMRAIESLTRSDELNDVSGMLRIFVATMWSTGVRPVEVWNIMLFVARRDIPLSHEQRRTIRNRPTRAIEERLLIPIDQAVAIDGESSPGVAAWNACVQTGLPAVVMIRSAKQKNARDALASPVRFQLLEGIDRKSLTLIAAASYLRKIPVSEMQQDALRSSMDRSLKRIGRQDPALKGLKLNLYTMRHSFATRVKATMSKAEAAALTGHTSKRSLSGYGERNLRKLRSGDNWTPLPDPERALQIATAWGSADPAAELYYPPEPEGE